MRLIPKRCVQFVKTFNPMEILEDNNFFLKLGLTRKFESHLDCTADRFREIFKENVSSDDSFKGVYFNKKDFKGTIKRQSFKIYKALRFPDTSGMSMYGAEGTYQETEGNLLINTVVYTPMVTLTLYYGIFLLINIILAINLWTSAPSWTLLIQFPMTILFGLFLYIQFKNGVSKLTNEIEREFVFWTK
jgi:hypothetical protein